MCIIEHYAVESSGSFSATDIISNAQWELTQTGKRLSVTVLTFSKPVLPPVPRTSEGVITLNTAYRCRLHSKS